MDLFTKLRTTGPLQKPEGPADGDLASLERAVAERPSDGALAERLATAYASSGETAKALNVLLAAGELARDHGRIEGALHFIALAESLATGPKRIPILERLIALHIARQAYVRAFLIAREIVEFHVRGEDSIRARDFLGRLPSLGPRDGAYRKRLAGLLTATDVVAGTEPVASWRHGSIDQDVPREDFSDLSVLLVEDDADQSEIFAAAIETLGCEVRVATDGLAALGQIAAARPALVISDLVMPTMDGSQLFRAIAADPANETIPFVCLSARGDQFEVAAALQRGVEDYWVKPMRPAELRARVLRILRRIKEYAALGGDLGIGLANVVQVLEVSSRTGTLLLRSRGRTATVYFADGRPIDAVACGKTGEPAFYAIAEWNEGTFEFSPRLPERERSIFASAQGLLLEAFQRLDEFADAVAELPPDHAVALAFGEGEPEVDDADRAHLERLRSIVDGSKALSEVLTELVGELEPVMLLSRLVRDGAITSARNPEG